MTPESSKRDQSRRQSKRSQEDWDDSMWNLLGKASHQEPDAMFARDIVRKTRLLGRPKATLSGMLAGIFSPLRISLVTAAVAAVVCITGVSHFWPEPPSSPIPALATLSDTQESAVALTELIISESLSAAAEDPSLFTRDEVVAMIGF